MTFPWRSALITGASSGIGEEMVRRLGEAGIPTVAVARRADRLEALAERWPTVEVLTADLRTTDGIAAVSERLSDPDRPVEFLVNNAGFGTSGPFVTLDPVRLGDEVDLNCRAVVQLSSAAARVMVERGRGWICNVASVAAFQPTPKMSCYGATKAFVLSFSEALHEELRSAGVHVTTVCPGITRTEFQSVSNTSGRPLRAPKMMWLDVDDVVDTALRDTARGKAVSVPGGIYKVLTTAASIAPRGLRRRVSR